MDRILRGAGGTVTIYLYDSTGALADAGGGNGSAAVTASDRVGGLFGSGTAQAGSPFTATRSALGIYNVAIPNTFKVLDTYDVAWTFPDGSTRQTQFEIVGAFLFTIADAKAYDTALSGYSAAQILLARAIVEEIFEGPEVQVAFRPRGSRDYLDGTNSPVLILNNFHVTNVISAKYTIANTTTTLDATNLGDLSVGPEGNLTRRTLGWWPWGIRNCEIFYEYGLTTVPRDVWDAALQACRFLLVKDFLGFNPQAIGEQTALGGFIRFSYPSTDYPFGIPGIDAVLSRYSQKKVIGYV